MVLIMEMEFIQNFLASPNLPDIIAYAIGVIILIYQIFAKLGIKKDNLFTTIKIAKNVDEVKGMKEQLDKERAELEKDRQSLAKEKEEWQKERAELLKDMNEIKKSVRLMSKYSNDLVKTGVSRKINRMLPVTDEEENVTVINKNQEDKNND